MTLILPTAITLVLLGVTIFQGRNTRAYWRGEAGPPGTPVRRLLGTEDRAHIGRAAVLNVMTLGFMTLMLFGTLWLPTGDGRTFTTAQAGVLGKAGLALSMIGVVGMIVCFFGQIPVVKTARPRFLVPPQDR